MVSFLEFSNEILSIAIVIISISMLLYNLTRNVRDRVTRASSILLGCVTLAYIADVFIALEPGQHALENWFRVQWIGVGLVPAALFHLSDALLATTGLVSRGRRRKAVRVLYIIGALLVLAAVWTDLVIYELVKEPVWHMQSGPLFAVYLVYFVLASSVALSNVVRAWRRCLTTTTRRRMTYLLAAFLTPAWGIFPYSLLFSALSSGLDAISEIWLWLIFNVANLAVLAMLAFMAYPLSFFGAYKPDRVVKAELLQFMLRGPLTGVVIVAVIQSFPRISTVLGVEGQEFMTFAAVGAVLCLQWGITLIMPWLENNLIYTQDQQQARLFQEIGKRLMTRADAEQLLEAILAAVCDQLRVPTAFIASIDERGARLEHYTGDITPGAESRLAEQLSTGPLPADVKQHGGFFRWQSFWLIPLRLVPTNTVNGQMTLLGLLGVWARSSDDILREDEERVIHALKARVIEVLTDMRLQTQVLTTLEGLVTGPSTLPHTASISAYGYVSMNGDVQQQPDLIQLRKTIVGSPEFTEKVKNALRDYWGGPHLVESDLLQLGVVDEAAAENDGNRVNALRRVLVDAIDRLRPEGQQNFTRTEWILYNILEMRFLQGRKVRDVALRLAMSQADFYRKQRAAIEEVARVMAEMEHQHIAEAESEISGTDVHAVFQ